MSNADQGVPGQDATPTSVETGCAESRLLMSRRTMLGATAGLFSWAMMPRYAEAATAGGDPRLLVVVLRGGMDGLSAVVPNGDIHYFSMRGELAIPASRTLRLNSFFGLHPALKNFAAYYRAGDAAVVHATCVPLRSRSHFDAQDNLENGLPGNVTGSTGWLNRLLTELPAGQSIRSHGAIQIGEAPLLLRGPAPVLGWSASTLTHLEEPTLSMVRSLYQERDPQFYDHFERGLRATRMADGVGADSTSLDQVQSGFRGAGRLLAAPDGPRVAVLSIHGWDTHTDQGGAVGSFATNLTEIDQGLAGFKANVGAAWDNTVVLLVTEFGRTVQNNGNHGTDHGVGTVALLAGGAVNGGKIHVDWPGLAPKRLYEGRDLMPTTDIRSVFKGVLREHLGVPDALINGSIFPQSSDAPPLQGLVKGA